MSEQQYFTPAQLAERWGVAKKTLANQRARNQGPSFIKLGPRKQSHVRYAVEEVLRLEQSGARDKRGD